jgi:hypothetical protein
MFAKAEKRAPGKGGEHKNSVKVDDPGVDVRGCIKTLHHAIERTRHDEIVSSLSQLLEMVSDNGISLTCFSLLALQFVFSIFVPLLGALGSHFCPLVLG